MNGIKGANKPKISIIMPVYNAEKWLDKSIVSVLKQSYENWELIVINDASDDSSQQIIENFSKQDSRIIPLKNERSIGAGLSRNKAVEKAKGEYLMFLDADDLYNSELCLKVADIIEKFSPDIIEYPFSTCDENGNSISEAIWLPKRKDGFINLNNYWFLYATSLWCRAFRKEFILQNQIKNSDAKSGQDNNFIVPAFLKAKSFYFFYLKDAYIYRKVSTSLSSKAKKNANFKNHQKIWNIVKEDLLRLNVYDEKRFNLMRFVSAMWSFSFNPLSSRDQYLYVKDMIQGWNLTKDDFKKYNLDCYSKYKKIKKYPYWILFLKYKIFMRKK